MNERPSINTIRKYDPRDMSFYDHGWKNIPNVMKSDENQKYASEVLNWLDELAEEEHQERVRKLKNFNRTLEEIEEFEDFNFQKFH